MRIRISKHTRSGLAAAGLATAVMVAGSAEASVYSSSPTLPLIGVPFISSDGPQCFPAAGLCVTSGAFTQTMLLSSMFTMSGQDLVTDATYTGVVMGGMTQPITLTGTVEEVVLGRTFSTELGSFDTEVTALSLSGVVAGHTLTMKLDTDPAHDSTGETTLAADGSVFKIDSFFDVFVELSLDSMVPLHATVGPIHLVAVPEPSTWAMMLLGFAGLGFGGYRRRRGLAGSVSA
jgi:hypothetical protein